MSRLFSFVDLDIEIPRCNPGFLLYLKPLVMLFIYISSVRFSSYGSTLCHVKQRIAGNGKTSSAIYLSSPMSSVEENPEMKSSIKSFHQE